MKVCCRLRNFFLPTILLMFLLPLVGCNSPANTGNASSINTSSQGRTIEPTVVSNGGGNKSGIGPIVIQSPSPIPGGSASSQQIALADRILMIERVSRQANVTTGMTTVTIKIIIKNIGHKNINNLAAYYQIIGAEGDMFGLPAKNSSSFFGTIGAGSLRSGTLIFQQIPTAAIKKLQLLYRAASAQVVFVPLNT